MNDPEFIPDYFRMRDRERKRKRKEARMKRLLLIFIALFLAAIVFFIWGWLSKRYSPVSSGVSKQQITKWYEDEAVVRFLTVTFTVTPTATNTVPTATLTATETSTPTQTSTTTLTSTPILRPATATPENPMDNQTARLLSIAETTVVAAHVDSADSASSGSSFSSESDQWYELLGEPSAISADEIYVNAACSWMGVAGIVTDLRNDPVIGMYIQVGGFENSEIKETLSGLFPNYGDSGYEITIARPVQKIDKLLWIQILDSDHRPVSEKIFFKPSDNCEKSLMLINFHRTR